MWHSVCAHLVLFGLVKQLFEMSYFTLFISALVSATLLPGSSEVLLGFLVSQSNTWFTLWLVATVGNVLGSCINYVLGWQVLRFKDKRWFPVNDTQLVQAKARFKRYGKWSLLAAWMPIIGDPLTVFAGVFRLQFGWFLILTTIGKAARYAMVIWFALRAVELSMPI
ncbi:probable membrane protein YPO3302 [Pseudoalteromonas luteoviolacea B = ATCC 29581]|nr:probable membrane protein YPO3302 [Pseudoalteromonas luteoviolacea B = ATCC 29581]